MIKLKPMNIISAYQSIQAFYDLEIEIKELTKGFNLSIHEAQSLSKFVSLLQEQDIESNCFNGYYIGYSINQISKEFDLLRFSNNLIINIEIKAPLIEEYKLQKICDQMNQNYYYLKFLNKEVHIYTYVEDDGLYIFNIKGIRPQKIDVCELVKDLSSQQIDYNIDPDNLFVPSNYLISPFNSTDKFLKGEYFLTDHQLKLKKDILAYMRENKYILFCIHANAGTGKTLLVYDLAKSLIQSNKLLLIIHCGKLNNGHDELKTYGWRIISIRSICKDCVDSWNDKNVELIIVDESQRISTSQLNLIINKSIEFKIPIVFTYDTKQYLKEGESKDIYDYIKNKYIGAPVIKQGLTNKIRTNKEIASFIKNLVHIGSSNTYLNYENVTIEYFQNLNDVYKYINDLQEIDGWKAITFTTSSYNLESLENIARVCYTKAHDVIGQEFKKVVFVMDSNFMYDEYGKLTTTRTYYSASGMMYQIVTRVVDELKIIVLNNQSLFIKLLEIKHNLFIKGKQ